MCLYLFFFNDTATTEIYTLSLHDALPIFVAKLRWERSKGAVFKTDDTFLPGCVPAKWNEITDFSNTDYPDRKSTRLNSSHLVISYAVFCLKKKNTMQHSFPDCIQYSSRTL